MFIIANEFRNSQRISIFNQLIHSHNDNFYLKWQFINLMIVSYLKIKDLRKNRGNCICRSVLLCYLFYYKHIWGHCELLLCFVYRVVFCCIPSASFESNFSTKCRIFLAIHLLFVCITALFSKFEKAIFILSHWNFSGFHLILPHFYNLSHYTPFRVCAEFQKELQTFSNSVRRNQPTIRLQQLHCFRIHLNM